MLDIQNIVDDCDVNELAITSAKHTRTALAAFLVDDTATGRRESLKSDITKDMLTMALNGDEEQAVRLIDLACELMVSFAPSEDDEET